MKKLYIIGARGCGRETYGLFLSCKETLGDVECIGFLDDDKDALNQFPGYPPIISSVEEYTPTSDDVFICALGDPKWVHHYTSIIEGKGGKFISLISPLAHIGMNTKIGVGCIISKWTVISCDVRIGNHTYIGVFSDIGHDVIVNECCHIGPYSFMGGYSELGHTVTLHPRVNILPYKKVGNNSTVGTCSVVMRNVKENTSVFGIPAKKI